MADARIYLINLDRSPHRLAHMQQQFDVLGLPFERVSGVDGRLLDLTRCDFVDWEFGTRFSRHGRLHLGQIGCYLSHLAVWKQFLQSDAAFALVLEDDVVVGPDLAAALDYIQTTRVPWNMMRFYGLRAKAGRQRTVEQGLGRWRIERLSGSQSGTQGYALTRKGAEQLLAALSTIRYPIDTALDRYWQHHLPVYALKPYPILGMIDVQSEVGDFPPNKPANLRQWLDWRYHTISGSVGRVWFDLWQR